MNRKSSTGFQSSSPVCCIGGWLNCPCAPLRIIGPMNPGINVAITTNQSVDITSSFETRIWIQPDTIAMPNLTDRDVGGARLINQCSSPTAIFRSSHCNHVEGIKGSMQRYVISCREPNSVTKWYESNRGTTHHSPQIPDEQESCEPDEICVNSFERKTHSTAVARCVKKVDFRSIRGNSIFRLGNQTASMILSQEDGSQPMEAGFLEAAYAGNGAIAQDSLGSKSRSCHDCVELSTPQLEPDTNILDLQADTEYEIDILTGASLIGIAWVIIMGTTAMLG